MKHRFKIGQRVKIKQGLSWSSSMFHGHKAVIVKLIPEKPDMPAYAIVNLIKQNKKASVWMNEIEIAVRDNYYALNYKNSPDYE